MESAISARLNSAPIGTRAERDAALRAQLWRGAEQAAIRAEPTGHAALDRALPGGGWPIGAVSEVLHARTGVGELSLTLPLLSRTSRSGRPVVFLLPPAVPYAPALAAAGLDLSNLLVIDRAADESNGLWAAEQVLRAGAGAIVLWLDRVEGASLRRLQLAAEAGDGCALLLRSDRFAGESTPSALRLRVWRERSSGPCVEVLKCRGAKPARVVA